MKKTVIATLVSLFAMVGAYAAAPGSAVTMSTDPAKAAAVEHHAQELQAHATSAVKPVVHTQKKAGTHHKHHASHKKGVAKK